MSSSEEEFDDVPISKLKKAKNGKSNRSRSVKEESDEDFIADAPPRKARAKRKTSKTSTTNQKQKKTSTKRKVKKEEPNSDDDFQPKKKKKKTANGNGKAVVKKETVKKLKKLEKADRMVRAMQSFLWWDAPEPPEGCQWSTMEHTGPSFTENYESHGVKMKYNGKDVDLNQLEEEAYVPSLYLYISRIITLTNLCSCKHFTH
jgi:DNA topoisomerase-1